MPPSKGSKKPNLNKVDYDKDGVITPNDRKFIKIDKNKDGRISEKEEKRWTKERPSKQVTTIDPETGQQTTTYKARTPRQMPGESPLPGFGINQAVIDAYPSLKKLINQAIRQQWTEEQWWIAVEESEFGQQRIESQQQFDIGIAGPNSEDWLNRIDVAKRDITNAAMSMGLDINNPDVMRQIDSYSRQYIRDGLDSVDVAEYLSGLWGMPEESAPMQGDAASISSELRRLADDYGITLNDYDIESKTRTALAQGSNWQSWIEGQRDIFRQQAKTLYANASDLLETQTLRDILDPYMSDASDLLGINKAAMSTTDTMWSAAVNGDGRPMTRQEWLTRLKTDKQYGWDQSANARDEFMSLADSLAAAFGRA